MSVSGHPNDTPSFERQVTNFSQLRSLVLKGFVLNPDLIQAITKLPFLETVELDWKVGPSKLDLSNPKEVTGIRQLRLQCQSNFRFLSRSLRPLLSSCLESLSILFGCPSLLPRRRFLIQSNIFPRLKRMHFYNVAHDDAATFISNHRGLLEVNVTNDACPGQEGIRWLDFYRLATRLPKSTEKSRWDSVRVHQYAFVRAEDAGSGMPSDVFELTISLPDKGRSEDIAYQYRQYRSSYTENEVTFLHHLARQFPCLRRLSCQMEEIFLSDFLQLVVSAYGGQRLFSNPYPDV